MGYCPILLKMKGKKCVVIGGGTVALRKVNMLLDCGASITVISPEVDPDLAAVAEDKGIPLVQRDYKAEDLKNAAIVIAATDRKKINRKVAEDAKRAGALVNVVDDPETSDFIVPSILRRGDLTISVSTSGSSPALARKIRTKLEKSFEQEYASLVMLVEEVRNALTQEGVTIGSEAWQESLDLDRLIDFLRKGQYEKAKVFLSDSLKGSL